MFEDETPPVFSRRSVVCTSVSTALSTASLVSLAALGAAPPATESAFAPAQLHLIEAVVDRLIPSDELGPGARECGVATYIDRSFAGALAAQKTSFSAGLASIDALAQSQYGAVFADVDAARQDALLTAMEQNQASGFEPNSRAFFYRVRQVTWEGMFGDPFYGGNRDFAGWDLIRYPGPRMAVSPDEQRIREPIKPLRVSARGGRHGN